MSSKASCMIGGHPRWAKGTLRTRPRWSKTALRHPRRLTIHNLLGDIIYGPKKTSVGTTIGSLCNAVVQDRQGVQVNIIHGGAVLSRAVTLSQLPGDGDLLLTAAFCDSRYLTDTQLARLQDVMDNLPEAKYIVAFEKLADLMEVDLYDELLIHGGDNIDIHFMDLLPSLQSEFYSFVMRL